MPYNIFFSIILKGISRYLPHSFSAAVTASSINGLLKQVGIETGGCTSTTRDPGTPTASSVCTMEKASRVFPYTRALPSKRKSLIINTYCMATIVRALWLAAERALFSCNDKALWNFFSARRLFWVVSTTTCTWAKTTKKMTKYNYIFNNWKKN